MYIVSLKRSSPQALGGKLKKDFQNFNSFAKMQPTHWALIPV